MESSDSRDSSSIRRRRKTSARTLREQTPDPNFKPAPPRRKYSNDMSAEGEQEAASASEGAVSISMQIRPPRTMSAHESKILRKRDKTFATGAARSLSQPRQAERISPPDALDLVERSVVNKRSLSSPRHKHEESSESEMQQSSRHFSPPYESSMDESLSRMEQNLRRFEHERKRFEAEKRLFEREKRELKLRYKQIHDTEERKRILQNYRKLSDRMQQPPDQEDKRRLISQSLRLQRDEVPVTKVRSRHATPSKYEESSTQFSSSEGEREARNPVKRHVSALPGDGSGSNGSQHAGHYAISSVRGPPPQPPARKAASRNNSISPIRPLRRSRTPDERNMASSRNNSLSPVRQSLSRKPAAAEAEKMQPNTSEKAEAQSSEQELRQRKTAASQPAEEAAAAATAAAEATPAAAPIPQFTTPNFLQRLFGVKPKPILPEPIPTLPNKMFSRAGWQYFRWEARMVMRELISLYPLEYAELCRLNRQCIVNFIFIILLCGFGGLIFRYTEGNAENIYKCEVRKVRRDFIDNLWSVSHSMREDDWKSLARQKLRKFEEELQELKDMTDNAYYPGMTSWNFINSVVYCWTVVTSIGYGHITPKTTLGQALTIVYAIIGIPMFLILLADFGKVFTRALKFLWAYVRRLYYTRTCRRVRKQQQVRDALSGINTAYDIAIRRPSQFFGMSAEPDLESQSSAAANKSMGVSHPETPTSQYPETYEIDDEFNLPVSVATILLVSYMLIGAFVYTRWENWSYFQAIYFVFVSMSTIGFGDLVPNHPIFMMLSILYLIFGLALTSMFINVVQIKLSDTFAHASSKIGATIGLKLASEMGDEAVSQLKTPSEMAAVHTPLNKLNDSTSPPPILRPAKLNLTPSDSELDAPPPLLPKKQVYVESPEAQNEKKKRSFF